MQIKIEKRLLEVEKEWNSKIATLLASHSQNNIKQSNRIVNGTRAVNTQEFSN